MHRLTEDGTPSFYVYMMPFHNGVRLHCCTHRVSEKDIPVWCKTPEDTMALMDLIQEEATAQHDLLLDKIWGLKDEYAGVAFRSECLQLIRKFSKPTRGE